MRLAIHMESSKKLEKSFEIKDLHRLTFTSTSAKHSLGCHPTQVAPLDRLPALEAAKKVEISVHMMADMHRKARFLYTSDRGGSVEALRPMQPRGEA